MPAMQNSVGHPSEGTEHEMSSIDEARAAISGLFDVGIQRSAVISEDGLYRYRLDRWWGDGPRLVFCMLNPSTADAEQDDPTIRRCISFARREGHSGITVINIGAGRATDPKVWAAMGDPFGPKNRQAHSDAILGAAAVVAAWGAHPLATERGKHLAWRWNQAHGIQAQCLGMTKDGSPRHPLYVRGDQPLVPFRGAS